MKSVYKFILGLGILASLIIVIAIRGHKISRLNNRIELLNSSIRAYNDENAGLKSSNSVYRLTLAQLNQMYDSVTITLREVQKELGIKDTKLKSLQYILSTYNHSDTIYMVDTIFREDFRGLDTIVGDKWFSVRLSLSYPSKISLTPKCLSELYLFTSSKRETVNERRKFFLWRLFQKKYTVLTIDIHDKNPYSEIVKNRFIEIVK